MRLFLVALSITLSALNPVPANATTPLDAVVVLDGFVSSGAQVRLLNASPDTGPVDLYVAQYREAENIEFEQISEAASVPSVPFLIRIYPAGETDSPLIEQGVSFEQFREHSLVLSGMADDLELLEVVSSGGGSSPSDAYVRFVHTSPDAGAMDFAITGGDVVHAGIEFRQSSDFFQLPGGTYDFVIRDAGETQTVVDVPGVWMQATRFYTIYLTGLEADEGQGDQEFYSFVPAAARNKGAAGSNFVTDVDVLNFDSAQVTYQLMWLPRDTDNSEPLMSESFTLAAAQTVRHADVLQSVFGFGDDTPAVGALGVICDSEHLSVFSRTFNQTEDGTYGQGMAGIPSGDLIQAGTVKRVMFMTQNPDFRSNLGILNGSASPITVQWKLYLADGTFWSSGFADLPAWGNIQKNRIFAAAAPVEAGYVEIWSETHGAVFAAYGSVLDNPTSDPTTVMAQ